MKVKATFASQKLGMLFLICLCLFSVCIQVNANGSEFKKSCVKCTQYGYKWCGNYNNPFRFTKCAKAIDSKMCKTKIIAETKGCYDKKNNPSQPGRPEPIYDDSGKFDEACHKDNVDTLTRDNQNKVFEKAYNTKADMECLRIINNESGQNFKVTIKKNTKDKRYHLYYLANTIEWYHRSLKEKNVSPCMIEVDPDPEQKTKFPESNGSSGPELEFILLSGRGFGMQVVNYAKDTMSFEVKMEPLDKDVKVDLSNTYPSDYQKYGKCYAGPELHEDDVKKEL